MNLPHLAPICFAKEVLERTENGAKVLCEFPFAPTLAMMVEAAAQSFGAFGEDEKPRMGFLVLMKEITLHVNAKERSLVMHCEHKGSLGSTSELFFEAYMGDEKVADGTVMIALQEV
ncbi:hypothetical protein [Sulfurospirillum deleyianum]|uniref:Uncharacterized protein n=1 Tax=Sulfurospirillum deleyianum (strain ATCC 51133 / DSM 6946 / 5175) TaxID=525898 RepID=D1B4W3_SULD5|nr:hypothetical protein [Sulfurospirillum deleyianum]ACZ13133.1 hypothetical protein Sdel_2121 [Sulfurospirillum deleyianum DSM 6946]